MAKEVLQSLRVTDIRFANGLHVAAPTDQWIALIFDVLHPTQQETIIERIAAMHKTQTEDKPLVEIPGMFVEPGTHLRR